MHAGEVHPPARPRAEIARVHCARAGDAPRRAGGRAGVDLDAPHPRQRVAEPVAQPHGARDLDGGHAVVRVRRARADGQALRRRAERADPPDLGGGEGEPPGDGVGRAAQRHVARRGVRREPHRAARRVEQRPRVERQVKGAQR